MDKRLRKGRGRGNCVSLNEKKEEEEKEEKIIRVLENED